MQGTSKTHRTPNKPNNSSFDQALSMLPGSRLDVVMTGVGSEDKPRLVTVL